MGICLANGLNCQNTLGRGQKRLGEAMRPTGRFDSFEFDNSIVSGLVGEPIGYQGWEKADFLQVCIREPPVSLAKSTQFDVARIGAMGAIRG